MSNQNTQLEARLNASLDRIYHRLQWIADTEARAAWFNGFGANGELDSERERLIQQAESVLDQLEAMGGSPKFQQR
ncbi:hypothetical protein [uncultured Sphingobium sp.]|jgi:hypothetical protein|uniref:hypothetical protein n=1 Tax=uncultured Sphingobium sp. TaxID=316087 RepID=UPI0032B13B0D|tara:strand:+ start:8012 stop:8239 length:228 start_codon:yes stop_codon:yes gene_type:complete